MRRGWKWDNNACINGVEKIGEQRENWLMQTGQNENVQWIVVAPVQMCLPAIGLSLSVPFKVSFVKNTCKSLTE